MPGLIPRMRAAVGRVFTATDGRDILDNTPSGWEVEQPWLWFDGPAGGDGTGGPWGNPPPGADSHWQRSLPAMARCRSLICDVLAGVPWEIYRDREQLRTPDWLTDPQGLSADQRIMSGTLDLRLSAVEFWSSFLVSALELGEGIIYVPVRNEAGQPVPPLFQLNPARVDVRAGSYWVDDARLDPSEVIVVRNRVWPGHTRGVGVWDQFTADVGLGGKLRDYASGMLGRGIPSGYLKVTAPDLSQDEADRLKERWMRAHGSRSDRRIAVLNATTDFHALQLDPKALELTELMRLSAWEICLIYGIPPYKLGISMGYSNTYANVESQAIDYVQDALLGWARRVESAFDAEFARGTSVKLNLDGLRRADTRTRYEAHKVGLEAGFLTVDEVRDLEDLAPMTDIQQRQTSTYRDRREVS